eukprot:COSAG03_NODE_2011_length_3221_cov_4.839206_3_plen_101_part_00
MEPGKDYPISWGGSPATAGMTVEEQYIFDLSGVIQTHAHKHTHTRARARARAHTHHTPQSDASRFPFVQESRTVLPLRSLARFWSPFLCGSSASVPHMYL